MSKNRDKKTEHSRNTRNFLKHDACSKETSIFSKETLLVKFVRIDYTYMSVDYIEVMCSYEVIVYRLRDHLQELHTPQGHRHVC